jgi:hypothetical protein
MRTLHLKTADLFEFEGTLTSGLHPMCLMYAGFKRVAPEHNVQMDVNDPYLTALQMHKNGEGKQ